VSDLRATGKRLAAIVAVAVAAVAVAVLSPAAAWASEPPEKLFEKGAAAIARGEFAAAIDTFEALADQGFLHPDASYDRGVAYVLRYRAHADRAGDLGRAAAAFEETLLLRPDDHEADVALDLVRAEVTRRRAKRSKDAVDVRPTLDRMVVGLAGEETWGLCAFAASLALAVGLWLRPRAGRAHIAGSILVPSAAVALVLLAPLAWGARSLRLHTRAGVVVAAESLLTDEQGHALPGDPLAEAASVEVGERRGGLVHVRWGAAEGWVPATDVRILGAP
jgi:tetratricopeptide (TPR) repeat protein